MPYIHMGIASLVAEPNDHEFVLQYAMPKTYWWLVGKNREDNPCITRVEAIPLLSTMPRKEEIILLNL